LKSDDHIVELAARQAKSGGVSLGKATSDVVRKGLQSQARIRQEAGLVVFDLPPDCPRLQWKPSYDSKQVFVKIDRSLAALLESKFQDTNSLEILNVTVRD
jgi:hypothetical protein